MNNEILAFMGLGGTQLMLLMGAVLLLFGPKKLPELARGLGRGIREFKKASNEVTEELERTFEEPSTSSPKYYAEEVAPEQSVPRALNDASPSVTPEAGHSAPNSSGSEPSK